MTDEAPAAPTRYSTAAIVLHWALAALLLFQISLGWRMEELAKGASQFAAFQLHKSIGITILLLTLARLAVRVFAPRPAPSPDSALNMFLAKAVHVLLYAVMIGGPLTGWIIVSTSKIKLQTMLFGTVPWPHLPLGAAWHEPAEGLHGLLALLFMLLFVLHVAGALRHHIKREDLLGRMLPAGLASQRALTVGAVLALLGLSAAFAAARLIPFGSSAAAAPVVASAPPAVPAPAAPPSPGESAIPSPGPTPSPAETPEASPSATASAAASEPAVTAASAWQVESGGRLGFRASYSGSPVDGTFKRWDADIRFSPDDLAGSKIRVTIDLGSADTADGERDDMLRSDSFFNVAAHPRAVFTSSSIRARGPGKYAAAGTLSLHGVSRPLTVDFDLAITGERADASGSAQLQRTAFGVGSGEWASTGEIADGVAISFRLKARRVP